jgi:hypothetical protein
MMEDRLLPDEDPRQYDGVLMTLRDAPEAVAAARRLLRAKVPTVDLTIERPDVRLPRVVSDHAAIGRAAAAHFRERGFSSLAWFSAGWTNVHRLRYEGFCSGCAAPPVRWARDGLAAAIQDAPKPVGVLAYNDVDAARLVAVCRKEGVGVPEDMAVLGIGNDAFDGCAGLTSITIPDNVTNIGNDAFCNCPNLKEVKITNINTAIGEHALGYRYDIVNEYDVLELTAWRRNGIFTTLSNLYTNFLCTVTQWTLVYSKRFIICNSIYLLYRSIQREEF